MIESPPTTEELALATLQLEEKKTLIMETAKQAVALMHVHYTEVCAKNKEKIEATCVKLKKDLAPFRGCPYRVGSDIHLLYEQLNSSENALSELDDVMQANKATCNVFLDNLSNLPMLDLLQGYQYKDMDDFINILRGLGRAE